MTKKRHTFFAGSRAAQGFVKCGNSGKISIGCNWDASQQAIASKASANSPSAST